MIYRQNWVDVRDYLYHMERARQVDPETVKRARGHLRHLLEWADETPFTNIRNMDPTFPVYLLTARSDGKQKTLAPASITMIRTHARKAMTIMALSGVTSTPASVSQSPCTQRVNQFGGSSWEGRKRFCTIEGVKGIISSFRSRLPDTT